MGAIILTFQKALRRAPSDANAAHSHSCSRGLASRDRHAAASSRSHGASERSRGPGVSVQGEHPLAACDDSIAGARGETWAGDLPPSSRARLKPTTNFGRDMIPGTRGSVAPPLLHPPGASRLPLQPGSTLHKSGVLEFQPGRETWFFRTTQSQTPAADHRLQRASHHGHPTDPDKEPTMAIVCSCPYYDGYAHIIRYVD
jgi:hypothetical protein